MAKQPVAHIPTQQPDATAGLTANRAEIIPLQPATPQHNHPAPQPPPPPCNQSQTFCPTENIPGAPDANKAYGTFKNNPPVVPATMTANSAFGKEPPAASCGVGAQYAEQNNTATTWTNLSQTTVVLGIDGNMSVQTGSLTRVSPRKRHVGLHAACRLPVEFACFFWFLMRYGRLLRTCGDVLRINQTERMLCNEIATSFGQKMIGCMRAGKKCFVFAAKANGHFIHLSILEHVEGLKGYRVWWLSKAFFKYRAKISAKQDAFVYVPSDTRNC